MSCRAAAKEFGLSKSAVERHKNGHLRPSIAAGNIMGSDSRGVPIVNPKYAVAAPVEQEDPDLDLPSIKKRLARLIDRLDKAVCEAAVSGTLQGLSAVAGQLVKALDRACVLEGHYPEKPAGPAVTAASGFAIQIIMPPGAAAPPAIPAPLPTARCMAVEQAPLIEIPFDGLGLPPAPAHVRAAATRLLEHSDELET